MIRTCVAVVAGLCGVVSTASGQVFTTYDSPAYTSYYAPASSYSSYYAPASSYSSYSYRNGWGPLGLINWRWPASPYASAYGGSYTAGYAPASYAAPMTTSYYAPLVDTAVAYYAAPAALASGCCTPCCSSCCSSCSSGSCPGGNCSLNYAPSDMSPRPDPMSSGSRTIESESGKDKDSGSAPAGNDDWRGRPADGYGGTERGAGYPPATRIQKKLPTDVNDGTASGATEDVPEAPRPEAAGDVEPEAEESFEAPGGNEPAASLLNLDTQVTAAPSLVRERLTLRARFQSPRLARGNVDLKSISTAAELRLVQK